MIVFFTLLILIISFVLALKSLGELEVPKEVIKRLKQKEKKGVSGVILFLANKVIHYTTNYKSQVLEEEVENREEVLDKKVG